MIISNYVKIIEFRSCITTSEWPPVLNPSFLDRSEETMIDGGRTDLVLSLYCVPRRCCCCLTLDQLGLQYTPTTVTWTDLDEEEEAGKASAYKFCCRVTRWLPDVSQLDTLPSGHISVIYLDRLLILLTDWRREIKYPAPCRSRPATDSYWRWWLQVRCFDFN